MDFTSAFTVQLQILKERLQDLGISSWLILWTDNFLRNMLQQVCVNGKSSDCKVLNSGLLQGCVSSSLLFSICINEIQCNRVDLTLIKYADNLTLISCQMDGKIN